MMVTKNCEKCILFSPRELRNFQDRFINVWSIIISMEKKPLRRIKAGPCKEGHNALDRSSSFSGRKKKPLKAEKKSFEIE